MNISLIITGGGSGNRFGSVLPKQFHLLNGKPVIQWTIESFSGIEEIKHIIITVPSKYIEHTNLIIENMQLGIPCHIIEGGNERQDSVSNALKFDAASSDIVMIHDAVRPLVSKELIRKLIITADRIGGGVPGLIPKDTIREIKNDGNYSTLDRKKLRYIQTPQVFRTKQLAAAYKKAEKENYYSTDDASLFEYAGYQYLLLDGEEDNIKITTKRDFEQVAQNISKIG